MTIEEFNKYEFKNSTRIIYKGKSYPIHSIDFSEALFEIQQGEIANHVPNYIRVRCENCEVIEKEQEPLKSAKQKPKLL